jgi:intracellular multiplication protein IcmD
VETSPCKIKNYKKIVNWLGGLTFMVSTSSVFATSATLGTMASSITGTFASVTKLITGGCYLAGLAFAVSAIMKFKQHKDNPTQITIGTPVALVFIAAALLFMPSILEVAGYTMFGTSGGKTAGPTGSVFNGS